MGREQKAYWAGSRVLQLSGRVSAGGAGQDPKSHAEQYCLVLGPAALRGNKPCIGSDGDSDKNTTHGVWKRNLAQPTGISQLDWAQLIA